MTSSYPIPSSSMSSKRDIYESTKFTINESLNQFNDFANSINEVCNQASLIARSLQSLGDMVIPELIGMEQVKKAPPRKFKNSAHLMDSLDTFSKIMMSFSEKIKNEALDSFENFVIQALLPTDDEIKGIQEHNSQIVSEFRDSFFSLYNHFLILTAELMEKFLICDNCSTPIGFPHQPLCLTESLSSPNIWKKINFDDKFIVYGMNFCLNDIVIPGCRKNILTQIASSCLKQTQNQQREKNFLPLVTNSWPSRWMQSDKDKNNERKPIKTARVGYKTHPIKQQSICKPSVWTPTTSDPFAMSSQIESFTFHCNGLN